MRSTVSFIRQPIHPIPPGPIVTPSLPNSKARLEQ